MQERLISYLTIPLILLVAVINIEAAPVLNPANGHYYDAIDVTNGLSWFEADAEAKSLTFMGRQGHLATFTSQQENDFLKDNFPNACNGYWLGGFQPPGSPEPDGGWEWITGEPWVFANWSPGEPNNAADEDGLQLFPYCQWNDKSRLSTPGGFVVEYSVDSLIPNFSNFVLNHALIKFEKLSESDRYYIKGSFTLGANSDGIDPLEEVVKLQLGTSTLEIPAGSFVKKGNTKYTFGGKIGDVRVYMRLKTSKSNGFGFIAWIRGIDLTDTPNPVPIRLRIGDDMGETDIWLSGILKLK